MMDDETYDILWNHIRLPHFWWFQPIFLGIFRVGLGHRLAQRSSRLCSRLSKRRPRLCTKSPWLLAIPFGYLWCGKMNAKHCKTIPMDAGNRWWIAIWNGTFIIGFTAFFSVENLMLGLWLLLSRISNPEENLECHFFIFLCRWKIQDPWGMRPSEYNFKTFRIEFKSRCPSCIHHGSRLVCSKAFGCLLAHLALLVWKFLGNPQTQWLIIISPLEWQDPDHHFVQKPNALWPQQNDHLAGARIGHRNPYRNSTPWCGWCSLMLHVWRAAKVGPTSQARGLSWASF